MGHNRNLADYAHHFDGTHIDLGSGNIETQGVLTYEDVTNVDAIGIVTARAGVKVPDNQKIFLGTSDDLWIFHDGGNSWVKDVGTGTLYIDSNGSGVIFSKNTAAEKTAAFYTDGAVELYYDNSKKLETTTTGATVTGTLVSDGVTSELDLSAISSSISDTAVDVFVYDTSKDSDGGAWRKRTQYTSWYNETLNTSTRGTRKEFPAVAVIVAESNPNKVTIYDGDDPDLPMWMVFNASTNTNSNFLAVAGQTLSSIFMLNGELGIGFPSTNGWGLNRVNFLSDSQGWYWTSANIHKQVKNTIAERNLQNGYYNSNSGISGLNNARVNDIAMTVLPNAPVDDATGLPVPTIALATAGSVSVIKDNGNVYDDNSSGGVTAGVASVEFVNDTLYYGRGGAGGNLYVKTSIGSVSANFSASHWYRYQAGGYGEVSGVYLKTNDDIIVTKNKNDVALSGDTSLVLMEDKTTSSLVAYATTSYNTGWMQGNIKGAYLSDTDATNVTGGNIVTNGDAWTGAQSSTSTTPPNGWTGGNAAQWRTSTGGDGSYIRLVNASSANGGPNSYMYQAITTVPGRKYKISLTQYHHATISVYYSVGTSINGGELVTSTWVSSSSNTPRDEHNTFTATGTTTYLTLGITSGTNNYDTGWDNVLITEVVDDRSVNENGLHSYGTITKSAVATGAELVAYSFGSNSNYLEQPYNSDLDYGTGDMYYSMWIYASSSDSFDGYTYIFERSSVSDTNNRRLEARMTTSTRLEIYANGQTLDNNVPVPANSWYKLDILRRSGEAFVYINGEYHSSTTGGAATGSLTDTAANLVIGNRAYFSPRNSAWPSNSKIALFRTGASAPSAEQVKKMYEDEKVLFQENAKATLYGSSDAVTALGYDEDTELLHVGTSSGRSDFQGLRRINNTTTAVTTAISAHDEFIVEQ